MQKGLENGIYYTENSQNFIGRTQTTQTETGQKSWSYTHHGVYTKGEYMQKVSILKSYIQKVDIFPYWHGKMSTSIAHQETSKLTSSWDITVHQLGKLKQKLLITRAREDVKKLVAIICCWWECTIEHDSRKSFSSVFKDTFTIRSG